MADHLRFCALIRDSTARNNCQSQKSCSQDWFFVLGSRDGFRDCAIGGMNIDVTLWAKWHGCGAGRSELGCSAGWTLGWVYWAATWNDAAPQVDIWNSAMFEFARAACLPISRTSRRVRGFQRRLRRSPLLRESRSLPRSAHRE